MARYDPFSPNFDNPLLNSSPDYTSRVGSLRNRGIGDIMPSHSSFRERSKRLRNLEDDKNQLIEDLIAKLEATQSQLEILQIDCRREIEYARNIVEQGNIMQDQMRQVKQIMDRDPYLLILIDGDEVLFKQELLSKGETGGQEAAEELHAAIQEYTTEQLTHLSDRSPRLVVRIYTCTQLLRKALLAARIIDNAKQLDDFIRGFNSAKPLFDFVDSGASRGNTRDALQELLRLNLYDCHCHQIILGCTSDHYAQLLEEVSHETDVMGHVSLLGSSPYEEQLTELSTRFKGLIFDGLFRQSKLEAAPLIPDLTRAASKTLPATILPSLPVLARIESNGTVGTNKTPSAKSTPAMTWATLTAQAPVNPIQPLATPNGVRRSSTPVITKAPETVVATSKKRPIAAVERNRLGQRIDKQDLSLPNHELQRIKKLKLCNVYYLQGPSFCPNSACSHSHSYPLSKGERAVLREVARMTPCHRRTKCDDPECIYGHRCPQNKPNESGCWYREECRFHGWGHGIDTRVVATTKV